MKVNRVILILYLSLGVFSVLSAQSFNEAWRKVESNNLTLKSLQQTVAAEKVANRVGLAPSNPEVEFAYLWGKPADLGHRVDFSVTQSFDFPSVYVYRSKIATLKNEQTEIDFLEKRKDLFLQFGDLYYNIVYQNVRLADMEHCLAHLQRFSQLYKQKLEQGEINIFDYNKVKLEELNLAQEKAHAEAERAALLLQLQQLNGGKALEVAENAFPEFRLPADTTAWVSSVVSRNPVINCISKSLEINRMQLGLERSQWAPQLMVGYMSEQVPGELFRGVKAGISVPLWQNAHAVRQAKMRASALQFALKEAQQNFRGELAAHYAMVHRLQQQMAEYRAALVAVEETELLDKALASGEISIVEYLLELSLYHESHERFAELQFEIASQYLYLQMVEM